MRNILSIITCFSVFYTFASAQENIESDTVKTIINDEVKQEEKSSVFINGSNFNFIFNWKKNSKKQLPDDSHWTGFGASVSYLNGLNGVNHGSSYAIYLNLVDYIIPVNKHYLFSIGLGFDWEIYKFRENVSLKNDDANITRFIYDNDSRYKSSKFKIYHLTIPFVFEYQTGGRRFKDFFVLAGVEVLVKTSAFSKAEIITEDVKVKKERYGNLNTQPLNARLILRAGFHNISFLSFYQPFSIFKSNLGPRIKPYGFGMMIDF
jgi:hypothetical protein